MERKEAIEILRRDWTDMRKGYFCINDFKAIEVALKSLETDEAYQLEYERTTKNDLGVDAIPRERIEQIVAEIERKAHNNQFNEAVHFGMNSALRVIRKYTEQTNEPEEIPTITIPVEDYLKLLDAIPRERIDALKAEIQFRIDNMGIGTKRSAYIDFLELIEEYTKEQNND